MCQALCHMFYRNRSFDHHDTQFNSIGATVTLILQMREPTNSFK